MVMVMATAEDAQPALSPDRYPVLAVPGQCPALPAMERVLACGVLFRLPLIPAGDAAGCPDAPTI
jgi:hypothetical protein